MEINSESCDILFLPAEILLMIATNLTGKDLISFSLSCRRLSTISRCIRSLSLDQLWTSTSISIQSLQLFLNQNIDVTILSECNFNNCFWLPALMLQTFIKKCVNVEKLGIAETKLNCGHLSAIFLKCKKVTQLSVSLHQHDLKIVKFNSHSTFTVDDTCLKNSGDCLKQIKKLEVVVHSGSFGETSLFISFCDSLKELALFPFDPPSHTWLERVTESQERAILHGKFTLNSFILARPPDNRDDLIRLFEPSNSQYLAFQTDMKHLTEYWNAASPCPTIDNTFSALTFKHFQLPGGMFEMPWEHQRNNNEIAVDKWNLRDPLNNIDLKNMTSLRENCVPIFMKSLLHAPRARLVSCFYSSKGFLDFCKRHRNLKVLKMKSRQNLDDRGAVRDPDSQIGNEWCANSWKHLSQLKSLSLEASLLFDNNESAKGKKSIKRMFHELAEESYLLSRRTPILEIVLSCSLVQEIEICLFKKPDGPLAASSRVDGEDLTHLSQCKLLRKLTLGNFFITDGIFLEEIITNCEHLETLRLSHLGSPLLCCYTKNLCASLPKAKRLKLFSIFQRNVVPMAQLVDTLGQCPSLMRLGLITPSDSVPFKWTADQLTCNLHNLCVKLPRLVALVCAMSIPKTHCAKAMKHLQQVIIPKRPSFCVEIQASSKTCLDSEHNLLPFVHELLVNFQSQIDLVPYDYKSPFF